LRYRAKFYAAAVDVRYREGAVNRVTVNAYERNPIARRDCISRYGTTCTVCGFDFERKYGSRAKGIIHVHHERPLSEIGEEYSVNAVDDLKPVCPNCHAVIHSKVLAYSIEQVREMIFKAGEDNE
jgi:5-methylcytosine-specific restriction protein A